MTDFISLKNRAEDEQPREKMLKKGASALADYELMAILIATGTRERSALDLGKDVLALAKNNLRELGRIGIKEIQKVKGIGEAKAITISAALELGRRRQLADSLDLPKIGSSRDAANIFMPLLQDLTHECFVVLFLNAAGKVIHKEIISTGGLTGTVADIRIILKNALLQNANQLVVGHNHPSGNPKPSEADKQLTYKLKEAARIMDITLLDHIIIAGNTYTSFADEGIL